MSAHETFDFKCQSLNVKGLNKTIKRRSVFRRMHNQNFHFIFLQETHSSKQCAILWEAEWGGKALFSHGTTNSKGVIILINPKVDCKVEKVILDNKGRYVIADITLDQLHITLANIYALNDQTQQVSFFREIRKQLEMCANENIVVGGDFNCALKEMDKKGGNPVSKKTSVIKEIEQLCNTHKLIDIWRFLNPGVESFTWRNKSFKIQCRLDYFLISKEMRDLVTSCKITHAPQTDHSAVSIAFKSETMDQKKGPGYWKFNNSLLKDEKYTSKLRENIVQYKEKYKEVDDLGLRWDLIKMEIRGYTIMYSKTKAKIVNQRGS